MTVLARSALFLSAFLPVFLLLVPRVWQANQPLAIGLVGASVLIASVAAMAFWLLGRGAVRHATVVAADGHAESLIGFVFGYIVPLTLIDGRDSYVVAVNAIAFLFMLVVAVRTEVVYLNPLLSLFGQHVVSLEVKADGGASENIVVIVGRPDLRGGARLEISGSSGPISRARVVQR